MRRIGLCLALALTLASCDDFGTYLNLYNESERDSIVTWTDRRGTFGVRVPAQSFVPASIRPAFTRSFEQTFEGTLTVWTSDCTEPRPTAWRGSAADLTIRADGTVAVAPLSGELPRDDLPEVEQPSEATCG